MDRKWTENRPEMDRKMDLNIGRKWTKNGPKIGLKLSNNGPKIIENRPKIVQKWTKMDLICPRGL